LNIKVSQGRCGGIFYNQFVTIICYKITAESDGERILKTDQH